MARTTSAVNRRRRSDDDASVSGQIAGQHFRIRGRDTIVLVVMLAALGFAAFLLWNVLKWQQVAMTEQHVELLKQTGKVIESLRQPHR